MSTFVILIDCKLTINQILVSTEEYEVLKNHVSKLSKKIETKWRDIKKFEVCKIVILILKET